MERPGLAAEGASVPVFRRPAENRLRRQLARLQVAITCCATSARIRTDLAVRGSRNAWRILK